MGADPLLQLVRLVVMTQGGEVGDQGEPSLTRWRLSISSDRQTTSLAVAH